MNKPRFAEHKLYVQVALAAPAVRTVAVSVSVDIDRDPGDPGYSEYRRVAPVLAIRSALYHEFTKRYYEDTYPKAAPTAEALIRDGWHYQDTAIEETPVVVGEEFGMLEVGDREYDDCCNVAYRLVACHWPPEEDEARLADTFEEVRAQALAATADMRSRNKSRAEAARS